MASPLKTILAALGAATWCACMVWFGTGLHPLWPLLWLAPLPVLVFAARSRWWAAALVALAGWCIGSFNMVHYYASILELPPLASAMTALGPALVFVLAVLLYRALLRRGAAGWAVVAFAALWVSFEYGLNLASPHATAGSIAYSQLGCLPVLQLASLTGPWGIGFLLFAVPAALAAWLSLRKPGTRPDGPNLGAPDPSHLGIGETSTIPGATEQGRSILLVTLAALAAVLTFGAVRLASPPDPVQEVKVGLVASDAGANARVAPAGPRTDQLLHAYAAQAEALAARGAQIIVLPEHVGQIAEADTAQTDALFQPLADRTQATIILGVSNVAASASYNQARIYAPGAPERSYSKHHMLPPFESMFTPGKTLTLIDEPKGKFGVEICKDMDFTPLSRQYGQAGAALVLAPAWDFQLDYISHGHMAIMRAVEDGFSLARAGRGGSLLVTDNRGRILAETRTNTAPFATLLTDVPAMHAPTLYLAWGDWFAWVAVALLAFTLVRLALFSGAPAH